MVFIVQRLNNFIDYCIMGENMNKEKCLMCGVAIYVSVAFFISAMILIIDNA